jgi:hypothetical protein
VAELEDSSIVTFSGEAEVSLVVEDGSSSGTVESTSSVIVVVTVSSITGVVTTTTVAGSDGLTSMGSV